MVNYPWAPGYPGYRKNTSRDIARQTATTYEDYQKIKGFEDVGYFLQYYVVSGGEVTKNITHNNQIDISETVVSLQNDIVHEDEVTGIKLKESSSVYFVDFYNGKYWVETAHPEGTAGIDYLTLATVSTDANGNINDIIDMRGDVGGFKLKDTIDFRIPYYDEQLADIAINISSFGVKGDGEDYTDKFKLAVAAAEGRTLIIPEAESYYAISDEITLPSNISIISTGKYPEIKQTAATKTIFRGAGISNVKISGLKLTGYDMTGPGEQLGLLHITGGSNICVDDCIVSNTRSGIWIQDCDDVMITHNTVHDFMFIGIVASRCRNFHVDYNRVYDSHQAGADQAYGIQATGNASAGEHQEQCTISYNTIENIPSWDGVMSHETNDIIISYNYMRNVRTGVDLSGDGIKNVLVIGNYIEGTDIDTWDGVSGLNVGILVAGNNTYPTFEGFTENVKIMNNTVINFGNFTNTTVGGGIGLRNLRHFIVSGNFIRDIGSGASGWGGISLNQYLYYGEVAHNNLENTADRGIGIRVLNLAVGVIIKDITINCTDGSMTDGIRIDSCNAIDCVIRDIKAFGVTNLFRVANNVFTGVSPYFDKYVSTSNNYQFPVADVYDRRGFTILTYRKNIIATGVGNTSGNSSITVSATSGIASGDVIHIQYLSGSNVRYFSTTVDAVTDGTTLALTSNLPADVPENSPVYVVRWETKIT